MVPERAGGHHICATSFFTAGAPDVKSTFYYQPERGPGCRPFHAPVTTGSPPAAILVIGGSDGSVPADLARALAARGYPSLALAYYGGGDLAQSFTKIRLDYFVKALGWLDDEVRPTHLLVFGFSRGSEAALLLGADFKGILNGLKVSGVIATSPRQRREPVLLSECHESDVDVSQPGHRSHRGRPHEPNLLFREPAAEERQSGENPGRGHQGPRLPLVRQGGHDLAVVCIRRSDSRTAGRPLPPLQPGGARCRSPRRNAASLRSRGGRGPCVPHRRAGTREPLAEAPDLPPRDHPRLASGCG